MVIDSYIIGVPVYLTRVCLLFGQEASLLMMMVLLLVPVELIVVFEMLVTMGAEIGLNVRMYNFMTLQQSFLFEGFIT